MENVEFALEREDLSDWCEVTGSRKNYGFHDFQSGSRANHWLGKSKV